MQYCTGLVIDMAWSVYIHITPSNKYYVGITSKEPCKRWRNGFGYYSQKYFYNAIQKYGWDNIYHEIVASNLTKEEANNFEKLLIQKLKSNNREFGYNITIGGDGVAGVKHTKEWCEQHSKDIQGENNPMYGKTKCCQHKRKTVGGYIWEYKKNVS